MSTWSLGPRLLKVYCPGPVQTYTMANDDTTILTQDSYRNRPGAQRWSQEETSEFYAVSLAAA